MFLKLESFVDSMQWSQAQNHDFCIRRPRYGGRGFPSEYCHIVW